MQKQKVKFNYRSFNTEIASYDIMTKADKIWVFVSKIWNRNDT